MSEEDSRSFVWLPESLASNKASNTSSMRQWQKAASRHTLWPTEFLACLLEAHGDAADEMTPWPDQWRARRKPGWQNSGLLLASTANLVMSASPGPHRTCFVQRSPSSPDLVIYGHRGHLNHGKHQDPSPSPPILPN